MPPAVKVVLNKKGMIELLTSAGIRADLMRRGRIVAGVAKGIAPSETGAYRAAITTWAEHHKDRTVVKVGSTDPKSALVEAATGTLARALSIANVGKKARRAIKFKRRPKKRKRSTSKRKKPTA